MSRLAGVLFVIIILAVQGCGAPDDETVRPRATTTVPPATPTDLPGLPVGDGDVGPDDQVAADGMNLRVNGRTIDLAPMSIDEFAVVRGGVFFVDDRELWFTDLRRARATGFTDVRSLVASEDGSRIAFLDRSHGPKDEHGTPLAISIAYDATTGRPLVASYAGMGDVMTDDLADLYEDSEPSIVGFEGDELVVHGATGGDRRITLDSGAPS